LFCGDERHVPPDHPDSSLGMANRALVSRVPIPMQQVHRIRAAFPDATAAARTTTPRSGGRSGQPATSREEAARVAAVWAPHLGTWRITLTPQALLDARAVLVIVAGAAKADAVHAALDLPDSVAAVPAHLLRSAGAQVDWIMDAAAAARRRAAPPW
jgi:6-phosphogluconolactonase